MRYLLTERFKRAYRGLRPELQQKADKALLLLHTNPQHPYLHLKKMKGTAAIWELRVDKSCRITLEIQSEVWILRNIGSHDDTLGNP
ncbi:MAG: hypothetical protein ACYC1M_06675 [Armatimonadota bacterium]